MDSGVFNESIFPDGIDTRSRIHSMVPKSATPRLCGLFPAFHFYNRRRKTDCVQLQKKQKIHVVQQR